MTEMPTTGHREVDEALVVLDQLDAVPVHDHVAVFDAVHDVLRAALTSPVPGTSPVLSTSPVLGTSPTTAVRVSPVRAAAEGAGPSDAAGR